MMEKIPRPVGKLMRRARAGLEKVLYYQDESARLPEAISLKSASFKNGSSLEPNATADGAKRSPALSWSKIPSATRALVLLIEDADSPTVQPIVHALIGDLKSRGSNLPEGGLGERYRPPDPPIGHGPHRYFFQVYALRVSPPKTLKTKRDLVAELERGNGIAKGCIMATYERQ